MRSNVSKMEQAEQFYQIALVALQKFEYSGDKKQRIKYEKFMGLRDIVLNQVAETYYTREV